MAELSQNGVDFNSIASKYFKSDKDDLKSNNNALIVLGTFLVWAGYMFFTGGRTYGQFNPRSNNSSKIIQNMFISSGFSGILSILLKTLFLGRCSKRSSKYDALTLCNGILIGMVAVSGVVDRLQNWGAVLIGSISAIWYAGAVAFLEFYRIDDPLEVFPVHGAGGIWGLFATGFFDNYRGALFYGAHKQGEFMGY